MLRRPIVVHWCIAGLLDDGPDGSLSDRPVGGGPLGGGLLGDGLLGGGLLGDCPPGDGPLGDGPLGDGPLGDCTLDDGARVIVLCKLTLLSLSLWLLKLNKQVVKYSENTAASFSILSMC